MNTRVFLILSLCLNAALGGYIIYKNQSKSAAPAPEATVKPAETPGRRNAQTGKTVTVTVPEMTSLDWRMVESEDYKKYIANLRNIGCPEETIRDIIVADVNKLFASRASRLKPTEEFKFWKAGNTLFRGLDEDRLKQQTALANEKKALLKELLGTDVEESSLLSDALNPITEMLDFLPKD